MKPAAVLSLCLATVLLGSEPPPEAPITKETAFTFYRSFKRLTKQPHLVAPLTATLCIGPTPAMKERERRATGPHYQSFIHVYVNGLADETIARGGGAFPPGAVIVKEKLAAFDSSGAEPSVSGVGGMIKRAPAFDPKVSGVGGMIKRAPGFDPANGDWEYFYCEKDGELSSGRLQSCAACHAEAKQTDYVFSVWRPFEP